MCRISNLKPPCGYNVAGLKNIWLLDFDDFDSFKFEGDGLSTETLVRAILKAGDFVEMQAPENAAYSSSITAGKYAHTVETFVPSLDAATLADLHLATKRRYIVVFESNGGKFFTFGYDSGATFNYVGQTTEATGALVTLTTQSVYPLFEASADVLEARDYIALFVPDFDNLTYCITNA